MTESTPDLRTQIRSTLSGYSLAVAYEGDGPADAVWAVVEPELARLRAEAGEWKRAAQAEAQGRNAEVAGYSQLLRGMARRLGGMRVDCQDNLEAAETYLYERDLARSKQADLARLSGGNTTPALPDDVVQRVADEIKDYVEESEGVASNGNLRVIATVAVEKVKEMLAGPGWGSAVTTPAGTEQTNPSHGDLSGPRAQQLQDVSRQTNVPVAMAAAVDVVLAALPLDPTSDGEMVVGWDVTVTTAEERAVEPNLPERYAVHVIDDARPVAVRVVRALAAAGMLRPAPIPPECPSALSDDGRHHPDYYDVRRFPCDWCDQRAPEPAAPAVPAPVEVDAEAVELTEQLRARIARDSGVRHDLDDVMRELGVPAPADTEATSTWREGDIASDRTNFVHVRGPQGWRTYPRTNGVQYSDADMEEFLGPLVRLDAVPPGTSHVGALPAPSGAPDTEAPADTPATVEHVVTYSSGPGGHHAHCDTCRTWHHGTEQEVQDWADTHLADSLRNTPVFPVHGMPCLDESCNCDQRPAPPVPAQPDTEA